MVEADGFESWMLVKRSPLICEATRIFLLFSSRRKKVNIESYSVRFSFWFPLPLQLGRQQLGEQRPQRHLGQLQHRRPEHAGVLRHELVTQKQGSTGGPRDSMVMFVCVKEMRKADTDGQREMELQHLSEAFPPVDNFSRLITLLTSVYLIMGFNLMDQCALIYSWIFFSRLILAKNVF